MPKILIVEDDPALQRLTFNTLQLGGYQLEVAQDGKEALEKVVTFQPDLILLDIVMPQVNGIEVLVSLKTNPETEKILIVVFTNAYAGKSIESAKSLGVTDFWVKSDTEPDALLQRVADIFKEHGIV